MAQRALRPLTKGSLVRVCSVETGGLGQPRFACLRRFCTGWDMFFSSIAPPILGSAVHVGVLIKLFGVTDPLGNMDSRGPCLGHIPLTVILLCKKPQLSLK